MKVTSFIRKTCCGEYGVLRWQLRRGFTLLELSLVMVTGTVAGALMLALFNQQITFLQMYRTQNFLMEEAPIISVYVNRIISEADGFSIHESLEDAWNDTSPQVEGSTARFNFQRPDGTTHAAILSFEAYEGADASQPKFQLYYYVLPETVPLPPTPDQPQWSVTGSAANVEFEENDDGILRIKITGPAYEQISYYSGSMQP